MAYVFSQIKERVAKSCNSSRSWQIDEEHMSYYAQLSQDKMSRALIIRGRGFEDLCVAGGVEVAVYMSYVESCSYAGGSGAIQVLNIVPVAGRNSLLVGEYNLILDAFRGDILSRFECQMEFCWQVNGGERGINDYFVSDVARAFDRFVQTANKTSAASHPSDRDSWNTFVLTYVEWLAKGQGEVDADTVIKLLREDYQWSPDAAYQLGLEFESGVSLLRQRYYGNF